MDVGEATDGEELLRGVVECTASVSKRGSKIASVFSEGQFTPPKLAFRSLQNTGMKTYPLGKFTVNTIVATDMENISEANTIDGITYEFIGMMNNLAGSSNFVGPLMWSS
ncbi:hypothetical protein Tco_0453456 [Tanacetum coccineum]